MKNYTKHEILIIILLVAKEYNEKLNDKHFKITYQKGKVQQKIAVLPYLPNLLYGNCMIGDFINSGIMIRADYFVGDTRATISVGFKVGKTVDVPVTLYHEDVWK